MSGVLMRRRRPQRFLRWLGGWLQPHVPPQAQVTISSSYLQGHPDQRVPLIAINQPGGGER